MNLVWWMRWFSGRYGGKRHWCVGKENFYFCGERHGSMLLYSVDLRLTSKGMGLRQVQQISVLYWRLGDDHEIWGCIDGLSNISQTHIVTIRCRDCWEHRWAMTELALSYVPCSSRWTMCASGGKNRGWNIGDKIQVWDDSWSWRWWVESWMLAIQTSSLHTRHMTEFSALLREIEETTRKDLLYPLVVGRSSNSAAGGPGLRIFAMMSIFLFFSVHNEYID